MQNNSSTSYFNRIMSQTPQSNERRQYRKNSQKEFFSKQRNEPIDQSQELILRGGESQDRNITSKKKLNQPQGADSPQNKQKKLSAKEQQELRQRLEQEERRDYLATKITPVLNKMLVKMVNQKPRKVLDFMIDFLKSEEGRFEGKRFHTKAPDNTIEKDRNMEQVFDETVAAKFLRFKK